MSVFRSIFFWFALLVCSTPVEGGAQPDGAAPAESGAGAGLAASTSRAPERAVRGFVSVEPFEVRLEALVEIESYREIWRFEGDAVTPENRQAILDNVATLLESGVTLRHGGGERLSFVGREVRFVAWEDGIGYVDDSRERIPMSEALVGATFYSTAEGVEELSIKWLWYAPGQERVAVEISSRGTPSARFVTPDSPSIRWTLEGAPEAPSLMDVPGVERERSRPLFFLVLLSGAFAITAVATILLKRHATPSWVGTLVVLAVAGAVLGVSVRTSEVVEPVPEKVDEIVYRTLRNIYHAFDFRTESSIYDTLEHSVTGPLLERVYLEIRNSLELESRGGPRVKVYEVALRDTESLDEGSEAEESGLPSIRVRSNWVTVGEVSHWGHTHERTNRYEAVLELVAIDTDWKLRDLELRNEERIQKVSRNRVEVEAAPSDESSKDAVGDGEEAPEDEP